MNMLPLREVPAAVLRDGAVTDESDDPIDDALRGRGRLKQ